MHEHDNLDLFAGLTLDDACQYGEGVVPGGGDPDVRSEAELRSMVRDELVGHAVRLQRANRELVSENRVLHWELREYKNSVAYFSQAAKLARQLSNSDTDTIAALAVEELPAYFRCDFAALFFLDPALRELRLCRTTVSVPDSERSYHLERDRDHFLVKLLLSQAQPFVADCQPDRQRILTDNELTIDATVPPEWIRVIGRRAVVMPLRTKPADAREPLLLGLLILGDSRRLLETRDAEVAVLFADLLSASLHNAQLLDKLNELTIIEPLTQIYNRRHLVNHLGSAMVQSRRHGHPLSVAMIDIDHFKLFNDCYGHVCGDIALRDVATILKESVRADIDVAARYGGEEFILVLPYTGICPACEVAERIRRKIRDHTSEYGGKTFSVTCSVGVAEYRRDESIEQFISRADAALYRAKGAGRDRVCAEC
ncbi:MAG: GGDEF domain-containing protein [Planctomycetes bacterium]|nr:GGDEF domain-containing protein [Planctomycetota bacterium]